MRFANPIVLTLLFLLPAVVALGWPRRGQERLKGFAALLFRGLILLSLILALAGFRLEMRGDRLETVFLLDLSDSMPAQARTEAVAYVEGALAGMGEGDAAALVVFGREALVERPMSSNQELAPIASTLTSDGTNLTEAMRLGLGLYSPETARRMVILSDGAIDSQEVRATAQLVAASGVEILVVPYERQLEDEVLLRSVSAPTPVGAGERFDLSLSLLATAAGEAELAVYADDQLLIHRGVTLTRGSQTFRLPVVAGSPGFTRYVVRVVAEEDGFYQNNELAAFVEVLGPPQILLVGPPEGEPIGYAGERRPDEVTPLRRALEGGEFQMEVIEPFELPVGSPSELATYSSVILVDVPARDLDNRQMRALQSYVRDLGGGLIAVGGPTSFGVGGYYRTPLEESLPVEMRLTDPERHPPVSLVFVIDYSGSMAQTSGGVTKLELAKEAVQRSVELLFPGDRVGVVAFDSSASWVVSMTDATELDPILAAVGGLEPGGGTDIYAGLEAMAQVLPAEETQDKHVILLTDGGADPRGIPELVGRLYEEEGITLTTVGVGRDAARYLPGLASQAGGRYHFAANPASIPSIFTEETAIVSRSYIVEEDFHPIQTSPSEILQGIQEVPPLHGYVATSMKPVGQEVLSSPQGDPILAVWNYGLGRAAAFTSDASGRWAQDWVRWSGFPGFWRQTVEYTVGNPAESPLEVQFEEGPESLEVTVDARSETGEYLNSLEMSGRVVPPEGEPMAFDLHQVAPGRYAGEFTPEVQGAYLVHIAGEGQGRVLATTRGWVLGYSAEYRPPVASPWVLEQLAVDHGGGLAPSRPGRVFRHSLATPPSAQPLWPWLLMLAASLLPADIAVRRLALDRADLLRAWSKVAGLWPQRREARPEERATDRRIEALMLAKRRARARGEVADQEAAGGDERMPIQEPEEVPDSAPQGGPVPESDGEPAEGSTAAKLLAKMKERRGEDPSELG